MMLSSEVFQWVGMGTGFLLIAYFIGRDIFSKRNGNSKKEVTIEHKFTFDSDIMFFFKELLRKWSKDE